MSTDLSSYAAINDTIGLLTALHNSHPVQKQRALTTAITKGATDCVKVLLNEHTVPSHDAVSLASSLGHLDILDLLLRHVVDKDDLVWGLVMAARRGQVLCVRRLCQSRWRPDGPDIPGADVNESWCRETPLKAALRKRHFDVVRVLVELGAKFTGRPFNDFVERAVIQNDLEVLKLLVELGMKANCGYFLRLATKHGRENIVALLLNAGVDANLSANNGRTALMFAAMHGRENIVRLLLDHLANPNAVYRHGHTSLMWAVAGNHGAVVDLLLRAGARIDAKSSKGESAYDMAVRMGFKSIATKLGPNKRTKLLKTKTPITKRKRFPLGASILRRSKKRRK